MMEESTAIEVGIPTKSTSYQESKLDQKLRRKLSREVADLEEKISQLDEQIHQLHTEMVTASEDFEALNKLQQTLDTVMHDKDMAEESWLEKSEELGD